MRTCSVWGWCCVAVLIFGIAGPVNAQKEAGGSPGPLRKLGRGIANVATCPAELLRTQEFVGRRDGYIGAITVGLVEGMWRTVLRGVTGVFEIATFYLEIPKGFEPLMKPEFVWAHGDWRE